VLPFEKLEVWTGVWLQSKDYHNHNIVLQLEKPNAVPPNKDWPAGCCDTAIVNVDPKFTWPDSGLAGTLSSALIALNKNSNRQSGHSVVQLHLIFCTVPCVKNQKHPIFNLFLAYVERFDVVQGSGASQ
jgi:hypothetical protein